MFTLLTLSLLDLFNDLTCWVFTSFVLSQSKKFEFSRPKTHITIRRRGMYGVLDPSKMSSQTQGITTFRVLHYSASKSVFYK